MYQSCGKVHCPPSCSHPHPQAFPCRSVCSQRLVAHAGLRPLVFGGSVVHLHVRGIASFLCECDLPTFAIFGHCVAPVLMDHSSKSSMSVQTWTTRARPQQHSTRATHQFTPQLRTHQHQPHAHSAHPPATRRSQTKQLELELPALGHQKAPHTSPQACDELYAHSRLLHPKAQPQHQEVRCMQPPRLQAHSQCPSQVQQQHPQVQPPRTCAHQRRPQTR